jgi:hypothetical protein
MQAFTDRMSCACFGLANTVTIMFYTVENATKVRRSDVPKTKQNHCVRVLFWGPLVVTRELIA